MADISEFTPWIAILSPILMGIVMYALPGFRKSQNKSDKNALDIEYLDEWKKDINKKLDSVLDTVNKMDKSVSLQEYRLTIIERQHEERHNDRNKKGGSSSAI